jgi:hypothetical protein
MAVEASSAVSRLHGSIEPGVGWAPPLAIASLDGEAALALTSGTAVGVSVARATWVAVGADGAAAGVVQAPNATAAIEMRTIAGFECMG